MGTVKRLLDEKGGGTNYTLEEKDSVLKALQIMSEANIGAVMVTKKGRVVGIFTERDYAKKCGIKGLSAEKTALGEVMTEKMMTVTLETSIEQCMSLMNKYHIRHLPVIDNNKFIGMVSMRDIVGTLLSDYKSTIKSLEGYIFASDFAT
jgi:CBS domain-containing protein